MITNRKNNKNPKYVIIKFKGILLNLKLFYKKFIQKFAIVKEICS